MGTFLVFKKTIWVLQKRWTLKPRFEMAGEAMYTIKILSFRSRAAATNSIFRTNSTHLVIRRALAIKLISILLKMRKNIAIAIFILILANRPISSNN